MNLVFASGFLMPQHLPGIDYFRGIEARFEGPHNTLFPDVPPLGTSEDRARKLADAILTKFPEGPVHIIAHSMGGLDSRILIARNLNGLSAPGRIASLTTLATPHHGSPVADLVAGPRPDGQRRLVYDSISNLISRFGVDTGAIANLTTESASKIPDVTQTHPCIRYRSYSASGRQGPLPTSVALSLSHLFTKEVTGQANDGVVALDSARYGEFQEPPWPCDHLDMTGHNLDGPFLGGFHFDHFAKFDEIVNKL
jgi:triacylglycerol lipase